MTRARQCVLLGAIIAFAALSYSWAINRDALEPYYAAGVRSMSMSWHNFFYGAFDPAGTVTLDKLPGAFWIQAVFAWVFGFHTWSIVLPQVLEGMLAVFFLYRAVARVAGPRAGLLAALVLAASPATVALNRGNISDSAMILLLVLAANSVTSAIQTGRFRHLIAAAAWVGLAFQTKMIEAWLVVPALGLAYLIGGPGPVAQRVRQVLAGGLVAAVISLSWMTVVTLVPQSGRPYVDGSSHDSEWSQVFVYNGFGRFGQQTPLQLLSSQGLGLNLTYNSAPGPGRLFGGQLGRDAGWLLPAALVATVAGLFGRRRSYYVLWGGWLVVLLVAFSVTATINAYYTAALSPPIAAVLGAGAMELWESRDHSHGRRAAVVAAAVVAGTAVYEAALVAASPGDPALWAWLLAVIAGIVAAALLLAVRSRLAPILAAVAAILIVPAVASGQIVADHRGAFDTPFESAGVAQGIEQIFIRTPASAAATIPTIKRVQFDAPYLLAVQTSAIASVFISASGEEALPIGGFTGTIPSPTLAELQADIRHDRFHLVLAAPSDDPRLQWIESHCPQVGRPLGSLHTYYCTAKDA